MSEIQHIVITVGPWWYKKLRAYCVILGVQFTEHKTGWLERMFDIRGSDAACRCLKRWVEEVSI